MENKNNSENNFYIKDNVVNIDLPEKQEANVIESQKENMSPEVEILKSDEMPSLDNLDTLEISQRINELPSNLRDYFKFFDPERRKVIVSDQFLLENSNEEIDQYCNLMKKEIIGKITSTNDYPELKSVLEKNINDAKIKREEIQTSINEVGIKLNKLRQELLLPPSKEDPPSILAKREKLKEIDKEENIEIQKLLLPFLQFSKEKSSNLTQGWEEIIKRRLAREEGLRTLESERNIKKSKILKTEQDKLKEMGMGKQMAKEQLKTIEIENDEENVIMGAINYLHEGFSFLKQSSEKWEEFCKTGKTTMKVHYMYILNSDSATAKILAKAYENGDYEEFSKIARNFFEKNFSQELDKKVKEIKQRKELIKKKRLENFLKEEQEKIEQKEKEEAKKSWSEKNSNLQEEIEKSILKDQGKYMKLED